MNDTKHGDDPSLHELKQRTGERRLSDRRKTSRNFGQRWTEEQIALLQKFVSQELPLIQLAQELGRTSSAIEGKAKELHISVKKIA